MAELGEAGTGEALGMSGRLSGALLAELAELGALLARAEACNDETLAERLLDEVAGLLDARTLARLVAAARVADRPGWTGPLRAPFPQYGGKFELARILEDAAGEVVNLVIPFGASLGELLGRRRRVPIETVNDADGLISNVWRSMRYDPHSLALLCAQPVLEVDLHAVHKRLVRKRESLTRLLEEDECFYDLELAAWWIWGRCAWIGTGWCHDRGEHQHRRRPAIGGSGGTPHHGKGIHAKLWRAHPQLRGGGTGPGYGNGINASTVREQLLEYFEALQDRLRFVRIICGDWTRCVTSAVTTSHGLTLVVLDPPYALETGRTPGIYGLDDPGLSSRVRAWALDHGNDPLLRIALCGIDGEHDELDAHGWMKIIWRHGDKPEAVWLSPNCVGGTQLGLFGGAG